MERRGGKKKRKKIKQGMSDLESKLLTSLRRGTTVFTRIRLRGPVPTSAEGE